MTQTCFLSAMEQENTTTETQARVAVPKGKYHDGTKSWFGSGLDTLDHLGEKFLNQEYGPGSDDETESRWENVGKKINRIDRATKFLQLAKERQWNLAEEDLKRLEKLVTAEKQLQEPKREEGNQSKKLNYREALKKGITE